MAVRWAPGLAHQLGTAPLSYAEVGATRGPLPPGHHHLRLSAPIGDGSADFAAAARALLRWQAQEGAGLRPEVSDLEVRQGSVAVLHLGVGAVGLRVPVRVVEVLDEPDRRGFAYGTLPGHPVRGEESFVVTQAPDGLVFFHVVAFSQAARRLTRLAGPLTRVGQRLVAERYLAAIRAAARAPRGELG